MMPEITFKISDAASACVDRIGDDPGLGKAIAGALKDQNELTVAHIQRRYLSFPKSGPATLEGLRFQSGGYRRSLRAADPLVRGASVSSSIGSNAVSKNGYSYPTVHEFGFSGVVSVGGFTRKSHSTGKLFGRRRTVRGGDIFVRPHQRKLELPARASITRGLTDRADNYASAISTEIIDYAGGKL